MHSNTTHIILVCLWLQSHVFLHVTVCRNKYVLSCNARMTFGGIMYQFSHNLHLPNKHFEC
jgi:hypothetical protein